jgi:hypothetical protein
LRISTEPWMPAFGKPMSFMTRSRPQN